MAEMLTSVLMWLGRRVAARGICLSFQVGQILRTFTISLTTGSTGCHLGFERDYNYHTAFRACFGGQIDKNLFLPDLVRLFYQGGKGGGGSQSRITSLFSFQTRITYIF